MTLLQAFCSSSSSSPFLFFFSFSFFLFFSFFLLFFLSFLHSSHHIQIPIFKIFLPSFPNKCNVILKKETFLAFSSLCIFSHFLLKWAEKVKVLNVKVKVFLGLTCLIVWHFQKLILKRWTVEMQTVKFGENR